MPLRLRFVVLILSVMVCLSAANPAVAFQKIGEVASKWGPDTAHGTTGGVVTWGFVPDGTTVDPSVEIDPFGSPGVTGVVGGSDITQLRNLIDTNHGAGAFNAALQSAFETWASVANITFVGPITDPGGAIGATGSHVPDIRIGAFDPMPGHFFEGAGAVGFGPPGFGGVELFPLSGDILFNLTGKGQVTAFHIATGTEDVTPVDVFNFGDDIEGLFLHELGHAAMGLAHPPWDGEDPDQRVMYVGDFQTPGAPICCQSLNRELHTDDIAGAVSVYGALPAALLGDANNDGQVTGADLISVQQNFGVVGTANGLLLGDANDDGQVTGADLISVQQNFGNVLLLPASVPEPATLAMLTIAGTALSRRR